MAPTPATTGPRPQYCWPPTAVSGGPQAFKYSTDFVSRLLGGGSGPEALVALLAQLLPVYETLERAIIRHTADPRIAPILDPRLDRAKSLRADLDAHRRAGRAVPEPLPVTEAYVVELGHSADDPASLVGHHYVRYLGDLSGGQIIARLVRRRYGLEDGLTFYDFDIPKPKTYKDGYRAALDALPLDERGRRAALDAAVRAFELNSAVFAGLDAVGARA